MLDPVKSSATAMERNCVFCAMPDRLKILTNRLAYAVYDTSPVTALHMLLLPRRHAASYFDLEAPERRAIEELLSRARELVLSRDPSINGFNIGINVGEVAGQTIFHCHYHLIPRRRGDVSNPRGGVRAVIPDKAIY